MRLPMYTEVEIVRSVVQHRLHSVSTISDGSVRHDRLLLLVVQRRMGRSWRE